MVKDKRLPVVRVYWQKGCKNCEDVEARLDANDVPYEMVDVNTPDGRANALMDYLTPQTALPYVVPKAIKATRLESILEGLNYTGSWTQ